MLRMAGFTRDAMVINGASPGRLLSALKGNDVIGSKVVGGPR